MTVLGLLLVAIPVLLAVYAYAGYPTLLWLGAASRSNDCAGAGRQGSWPRVSVSLPAFNEEAVIAETLQTLLSADYPAGRLQIVVVSDASTDRTDEIVEGFSDRGVELVRLPERSGKTAAEAAAIPHLDGKIVVNTDASVRVRPQALKPLVAAFRDPTVGVASGRDVSVGNHGAAATGGEAGYVGYEMWVRSLETRTGSIVGASGCFYAIRKELHAADLPAHLSRDFAAALVAREHGYRSVSVDSATCEVPRATSLAAEFRRKVRTMERGLGTLLFKRHLLSPRRHGAFAWKLFSHKLCRWLVPLTLPLAALGVVLLGAANGLVAAATVLLVAGVGVAGAAAWWTIEGRPPRAVAFLGFGAAAMAAGQIAWWRVLRGERHGVWEPTRRGGIDGVPASERSLRRDSTPTRSGRRDP